MQEQSMKGRDAGMDELDARVVRALERKPAPSIPADFAACVASQVSERRPVVLTPARYGAAAVRVAMAGVLIALVVMVARSADHTLLGVAVEWTLCVQLVGLALWDNDWRNFRGAGW
jgi:hypothetical protein